MSNLVKRRLFTGKAGGGGGGTTSIIVVANYSALPAANTVNGKFYWCSSSQGTNLAGLYYSNGVSWETNTADDITVVANYSALPAANTVSLQFYWCSASQGTSWLPGALGGTYYSKGLYFSNGTTWEFLDVPYQATQAEVDTGTNTDKFVTPSTLANSSQWSTKQAAATILSTFSALANAAGWLKNDGSGTLSYSTPTKSDVGLGNVDNTSDLNKPISTATSTALSAKADLVGGLVPTSQIPATAISEFCGVVADQTAMTAPGLLTNAGNTPYIGDWCIRNDEQYGYVLFAMPHTNAANWQKIVTPASPVQSVNGQTGVVVLGKTDIGLGNVPNTDTTNPANISQSASYRFVTDTEKSTWNGKQDSLGYTAENSANKSTTLDTDKTSDTKYPSVKSVYDWATGLFATLTTAQTLTNKRNVPRVVSVSSSATPTLNTDNVGIARLTGLAVNITNASTNLTGTPSHGEMFSYEITDNGSARTITWGTSFASTSILTLPTTTVASTLLRVLFQYNSANSKWEVIAIG